MSTGYRWRKRDWGVKSSSISLKRKRNLKQIRQNVNAADPWITWGLEALIPRAINTLCIAYSQPSTCVVPPCLQFYIHGFDQPPVVQHCSFYYWKKKATLLVDPFQTHIVHNSISFNKTRGSRHLGVCFILALLFFMLEIVNLKNFNIFFKIKPIPQWLPLSNQSFRFCQLLLSHTCCC